MNTAEEVTIARMGSHRLMWWVATSLLGLMATVYAFATWFDGAEVWVAAIKAFSEAAMVGALADWFAVTALFRRPLGLPIPHTAIIPRNKGRIGKSLGSFIQHNFLSGDVLKGQAVNLSGWITRWLERAENRRRVVGSVRRALPKLMETVEEKEIKHFLDQQVEQMIRSAHLCKITSKGISLLAANGMHEILLDEMVKLGREFFKANEDWFRRELKGVSPWFVPDFIDRKILGAMVEKAEHTLEDVLTNRNHELRHRLHGAVADFVGRLDTSEELKTKFDELREMLLSNKVFRQYSNSVCEGLFASIRGDIANPNSQLATGFERLLESFVVTMQASSELQERLNVLIRQFITALVDDQNGQVAGLIERTVDSWDSTTFVQKMEEQVGYDLQCIRINGTLVGGLVGLTLFGIQYAMR